MMMSNPFQALGAMTNNPLFQLANMARNGGNAMQMLQRMAAQNPQAARAINMIQGKTPQQLQQIATNMAQEIGTTPQEIARSLGLM